MPMPAAIVLFVCKVAFLPIEGEIAQHNAEMTGYKPYEWAIKDAQMQCRRKEVQLYDQAAAMGADSVPFTMHRCNRASWMLRMQYDMGQGNRPWRVWKTGCPVPIMDTESGKIIAWQMPSCPRINKQDRVSVMCELDVAI